MTDVEPAPAAAPLPAESPGQHHPHGLHEWPEAGIREGNHAVPRWLVATILALAAFFVAYCIVQWDAQPSSARMK
jgi:hypothetical protein